MGLALKTWIEMNQFTKDVVKLAVKAHPKVAKDNPYGQRFAMLVDEIYWLELMDREGWKYKQHAVELFLSLSGCDPDRIWGTKIDERLSQITSMHVGRLADRVEWMLCDNWEDYANELANPPLPLFAHLHSDK